MKEKAKETKERGRKLRDGKEGLMTEKARSSKGKRVNVRAVELIKGSLILHLDDNSNNCSSYIELGWKDIHNLRDFLSYASVLNTSALKDEIQDSRKMLKMNRKLLSEAERINSTGISYPWHRIKDVPRRHEMWGEGRV